MLLKSLFLSHLLLLTPFYFMICIVNQILRVFMPTRFYFYLDEKFYSLYQRQFLLFYERLTTSKIFVHGDVSVLQPKAANENILYIGNHQSTYDWFVADILIARQGGIGRLRFILQHLLKYIPFFGLYTHWHDFIYVNRKKFNAQTAVDSLHFLKKHALKSWLILYPEGTRINPRYNNVFAKSVQFAKELDVQPYTYHLTPRAKGLELVMDSLGTYLDAIYDITIVYADKQGNPLDRRLQMPELSNWLQTERSLHIHIDRIPLRQVPIQDKDQLKKWLFARFHKKDTFFKQLFEPARYRTEATAAASKCPPVTETRPWQDYVEIEMPDVQHTKETMARYLKPTTGEEETACLAKDGSLKRISCSLTYLPFCTMLFLCLACAYWWPPLLGMIYGLSTSVAALGLVYMHFLD